MSKILEVVNRIKHKDNLGNCSLEDIKAAEQALGLKFAGEYIELLTNFGTLTTDYLDISSTLKDPFYDVTHLTKDVRNRHKGLPNDLYVVYDVHIDGIVILQNASGKVFSIDETGSLMEAYDSLAAFISKIEGV